MFLARFSFSSCDNSPVSSLSFSLFSSSIAVLKSPFFIALASLSAGPDCTSLSFSSFALSWSAPPIFLRRSSSFFAISLILIIAFLRSMSLFCESSRAAFSRSRRRASASFRPFSASLSAVLRRLRSRSRERSWIFLTSTFLAWFAFAVDFLESTFGSRSKRIAITTGRTGRAEIQPALT